MDDAPAMGELQTPAGFMGDLDRLLQGKQVVGGVFDQAFNVTAAHELGDHKGLALA